MKHHQMWQENLKGCLAQLDATVQIGSLSRLLAEHWQMTFSR